ncbi:hypothetical protein D3C76_1535960 [compost metagenome]
MRGIRQHRTHAEGAGEGGCQLPKAYSGGQRHQALAGAQAYLACQFGQRMRAYAKDHQLGLVDHGLVAGQHLATIFAGQQIGPLRIAW